MKSPSIPRLCTVLLVVAIGACSADTRESVAAPATVEGAARVLDLGAFPLAKGAEAPGHRAVAALEYKAPGTVQNVFDFQRKQLGGQKWKESPGGYASDQAASGTFVRDGFTLSVAVFPVGKPGQVSVMITNHGNVPLDKLPLPPATKPFFSGPANAAHITEAPVDETAETCRKLLTAQGWQPYGTAGDVQFFKQNAIRLAVRVSAAPAQGGKTVIDYSTTLMSVDLPAPAEAAGLQYADQTKQLLFDTPQTPKEVAAFYRKTLSTAGWEATTDATFKRDFKDALVFRNKRKDMLTLEMYDVDGKNRVTLKQQSAAEIDELERRIAADAERKKMNKKTPLPKVAVAVPPEAKEVELTASRLEFKLASGKAKALVDQWRKQFAKEGWKEELATSDAMAGALSLAKGNQDISITYADPGLIAAEITLRATGVELERAGEKQ